MRMRQRDRRGVYQSIDLQQNARSPEQQEEYELKKAEERLRTIEMISKYREDKIKAEFRKLESDLKAQDHKNALEKQRAKDKRGFYEKHRKRTTDNYANRVSSLENSNGGESQMMDPEKQQKHQKEMQRQRKEQSRQKYLLEQKRKIKEFNKR